MDGDRPPHGSFAPVRLGGRRPPIERWAVVAAAVLVIVVAKPWQSPGDTSGTGGPTPTPRSATSTATPLPTAGENPDALTVAAFCLNTRAWLVASVERTVGHAGDQRIHVWRVLEPATAASGPDDPAIPVVSIVSEGLTDLGWCAPIVGDEKPSPPVVMTTWLRMPSGAKPIALDTSRPASDRTPYGDMYRPPGKGPSSKAASWPDGTYVFRYREADSRERWFAIGVETRALPSPSP